MPHLAHLFQYKGAKNLSYSSLCPKAAISLLWKSRRCAASNHHSSDFFTSCFLMRQSVWFLPCFLKEGEGRGGCSGFIPSLNSNLPKKLKLSQEKKKKKTERGRNRVKKINKCEEKKIRPEPTLVYMSIHPKSSW